MIGWQNLAALWMLPLLAVPVIVHLLRVHRADRVLFPSLRFVQPSRTAAVRLRMPSDLLLLALRLSIVGAVIAALAGPVIVTSARVRDWNGSTARAVIVDTSASMQASEASLVAQAKDAAGAEAKTATYAHIFEVQDLGTGFERAAAWLSATPPARREIVVLSDFQRGAVGQDTIARVPPAIGLRLVPIGKPSEHRSVSAGETLGAAGVPSRRGTIELSAASTKVTFAAGETPGKAGHDGGADMPAGIRFVNASLGEQTALLRALAHAGTPAGAADQPIAFVFDADKSAAALDGLQPIRERWMLRTVLRLNDEGRPGSDPGALRAGASGRELVIGVPAGASAFTAASIVRAALAARRSVDEYAEQEIARTSDVALAAWTRQAAPVDRGAWRTVQSTDARWCWLLALLLLGLEQWLRARQPLRRSHDEVTRVAA